jgi:AcrR family transcriptional regulator
METGFQAPLGLRERKKQRTRETIARVALELFAEHGFHDTTIKQIADAADVSPRTVSGYFPTKEELLFPNREQLIASLGTRLEQREPDETAMEALRAWLLEHILGDDELEHRNERCRQGVIEADPVLRTYQRGVQEHAERLIAAAVAVDLGVPADDLAPRMVGAATIAAMEEMGRAGKDPDVDPAAFRRDALALFDQAFAFLGAGVRGLQRRA